MKRTTILWGMLCLFFSYTSVGQTLDHVQGDLLIRIEKESNIRELAQKLRFFEGQPTSLAIKGKVSAPLNIWLIYMDHNTINEANFLAHVKRMPEVVEAQFNHLVTMRSTIPDDAQFPDQWQYINTGQSGGTAGADIDMDLAWDITTGGLTADGDTIVVAALDDGIDINHQDFEDNWWVNHAEIPDNDIDDDDNGYVDDYYGWNIASDDDNVNGGGHGTPVAGIMGAKGNNGLGVSGVSWDVKVMIIKNNFNTNEAAVLEAYTYPLVQRMRYNETDGAEGAFVVATNASWGIDFGDPADAPLWCAFYDTLGVNGIVSCGATINGNQNVDVIGDLPTACPSDYLISVTNMNHFDEKVTQAGYGLETIDLGAFGAGTWTTADNNGYGPFGGTSGATPHVTGTVGLLYAAPCPSFIALAKSDPGAAALLAKQYILDGTVPNPSLDGITVTGGRLNVFNTLQLLMDNCGPCPPASGFAVENVIDTSATLSWNSTDSTLTSNLQWRVEGAMDWTTIENAVSPFELSGLAACTIYEFRVEDICASDSSGYTTPVPFQTDGCCEAPFNFTVMQDSSDLILNWDPVLAAESYTLLYTCDNVTDSLIGISGTSYVLEDVAECISCTFQVKTVCGVAEETEYTTPISIQTLGCGACLDLAYCLPSGSSEFEFIEEVVLNDLVNTSGDDSGYGDFSGLGIELFPGLPYEITLTPGFQGFAYFEKFRVWIDNNQDGDFEDSGELVYDPEPSNEAFTGSLVVPVDALPGLTRMRVGMKYFNGFSSPEPCETNYEGEYEDYCITISDGPIPCAAPLNVTVGGETYYTADIVWEEYVAAAAYTLEYRPAGAPDWEVLTGVEGAGLTLEELQDCTPYEVRMLSNCVDGGLSLYSDTISFTTICLPACTEIPANLDSTFTDTTSVGMSWDATSNGLEYVLRYRPAAGILPFDSVITDQLNYVIENLDPCTAYEMQVRAICGGDSNSSDYSTLMVFNTNCASSVLALEGKPVRYTVYPNPFANRAQLDLQLPARASVTVSVLSINGQEMWRQTTELDAGAHLMEMNADREWSSGIYFLRLQVGDQYATVKLVKE